MHPDCLVVVSYYNARSASALIALLEQVAAIDAGAPFDLVVVVNREIQEDLGLPAALGSHKIIYRENLGYNIGAWHHAWASCRDYRYYLFLQDECRIERPNWLKAFIQKATAGCGVIGESFVIAPTIRRLHVSFPEFGDAMRIVRERIDLKNVRDWTHVQTTIVFATSDVLERTGGFVVPGNNKIEAIACEVAFSLVARNCGFKVAQLRFVPFEYISHPQWVGLRSGMKSPIGRLRRLVKIMTWALAKKVNYSFSAPT